MNHLNAFLGIAFAATFAPLYATTVSRFAKLEETVAKLAKRAQKLGLEAPRLEIVAEFAVPQLRKRNVDTHCLNWDDPRIVQRLGSNGDVLIETGEMIPMVRFRLIGQAPKLNGWTFRATLEHMEGETILATVPGFSVPAKYRKTGNVCEHCHMNRKRAQTFILENDDGRMMQVGRSCLKDFLGHQDPNKAASYAEELGTLVELCRASGGDDDELSDGYSGGRSPQAWNLADYLGYVAANIRVNGWVSRKAARDSVVLGNTATADNAYAAMFPSPFAVKKDIIVPEAQDVTVAAAALTWVRDGWLAAREEGTELGDYEHNVTSIVKMGYVMSKTMGITASVISAHARAIGREIEKKKALAGKHVGTEGKREVFKALSVARIFDIEGDYGVSKMHIFYDDAGNTLVWKASNERLDIGATYNVTATVKRHATNNRTGAPETWLSRAKAVRVEA